MPKKLPLASSGGLQSNDLKILWVINSSWEIDESPDKRTQLSS